jgi:peptidoglycan/xylan/chitin deacetylase (PgdA/CDA1 family)
LTKTALWRLAGLPFLFLIVGGVSGWLLARSWRQDCPPACAATPSATVSSTPRPTLTPSPSPAASATIPPTVTATIEPQPPAVRIPAIEYHDTQFNMSGGQVQMTPAWFREQMLWLRDNRFTTITAEQLIGFLDGTLTLPQRSVLITFDIGTHHADDYQDVIIPTLRELGFHAVFFVLTNAITSDGSDNSVTWDMLRGWQEEGLITVESHGVYHPDYRELSFGQQLWDATTSRTLITQEMGLAPQIFAFPFDAVPDEPDLVMEDAGYAAAVAGHRNERSILAMDSERYALPRYYPYSSEATYPILVGPEGWTFEEMMRRAIEPLPGGAPASSPTAQATATATPSTAAASAARFDYLAGLASYCTSTGRVDGPDIDQRAAFLTDVSPYAQSLLAMPVQVRPTCDFGPVIRPEAVVLHFTVGSSEASLAAFRSPSTLTSAHYIVERDGTILQVVPEVLGAYHVTCFGIRSVCLPDCPICEDANGHLTEPWLRSIGIEIVNVGPLAGEPGAFRYRDGTPFDGLVFTDYLASWRYRYWEDYPPQQVEALRILVEDIQRRWGIPLDMVIGHSRVQVSKIDPGPALNLTWRRYGDPPRDPIFPPDDLLQPPNFPVTLGAATEGF